MTPQRFIAGFLWVRERLGAALSNSVMLLGMNMLVTPVAMIMFSGSGRVMDWFSGAGTESIGATFAEQFPICLFFGCSAEIAGRFIMWLGSGSSLDTSDS